MPVRTFLRCTAALALLFVLGCSGAPEPLDPSVAAVRQAADECRGKLSQAEYGAARSAARNVLNDSSLTAAVSAQEVHPVRFCFVMAHSLRGLDQSSTEWKMLVNAIGGLFDGNLEEEQAPGVYDTHGFSTTSTQSMLINNLLGAVLKSWVELLEENQEHLELILADDDFAWHTDRLPIQLAGQELVDIHGGYGISEVQVLYGMTRTLLSTFHLLQSQSYAFNLQAIAEYAQLDGETPLNQYRDHPIAAVLNLAATLLETSPALLTLREDGADRMAAAGQGYAASLEALLAGIETLIDRPTDSGHLLEYRQEDGESYIVVNATFTKELPENLRDDLTKFNDVTIPLRENVLASLDRVRGSIAGEEGVRVHLQQDLFPIVSLVSVVALRSGVLDAMIDNMLVLLEPELADDLEATLELGKMGQDHFLMMLLTAVSVEIELDLGVAFHAPSDIRDIVPAWLQPPEHDGNGSSMPNYTEATLVYSYECENDPLASDEPARFLCARGDELVDSEHFVDLDNVTGENFGQHWLGSIAEDGIESRFPYIGFKDPTMGGVLYLDADPDNGHTKMEPASQHSLNAAIARTVKTILDVYGL